MTLLFMLVLFLILLLIGVPIYLVLGILALIGWVVEGIPLISLAQQFANDINSYPLMAVPLFVIAATFMEKGGITRALINLASSVAGQRKGALAIVCVIATTFFAAICGSSVATAMAMGTALIPTMTQRQYPASFSVGTVGAAGTLGILIPPSLPLLVYGLIAEESVPQLFLAGVIPGLLQGLLFLIYIVWYAQKNNLPVEQSFDLKIILSVLVKALPALLIPIFVLGGIYSGFVTVSEAAGIAAFSAIVVSVFIYKEVAINEVPILLKKGIQQTAIIIVIILSALAYGHWLTSSGITQALVIWAQESGLADWQFLIIANLVMLILGMFLEVISVLLIFVPLALPILELLDINLIHFGIIVVINMELALLTPPVGLNLFILKTISGEPLNTVIKGTLPYVVLLLFLLIIVTFIPQITLWLPQTLYP